MDLLYDAVIERSRKVMQHMFRKNLALAIGRQGQVVGLNIFEFSFHLR